MSTDPHRLRVLVLAANPRNTARLRLDAEVRTVQDKIRGAKYRDAIELSSCWAVRPDDLQQALLEFEPHVVHFSGQATQEEMLIFEDEHSGAKPVGKEALAQLFKIVKSNVRVVVLNACYSR